METKDAAAIYDKVTEKSDNDTFVYGHVSICDGLDEYSARSIVDGTIICWERIPGYYWAGGSRGGFIHINGSDLLTTELQKTMLTQQLFFFLKKKEE